MKNLFNRRTGFILLAAFCWLLLLGLGLLEQYHFLQETEGISFPVIVKGLLLNGLILSIYIVVTLGIDPIDIDFQTLLWKIFMTGLFCTFGSGVINVILLGIGKEDSIWFPLLQTGFFHTEFALLTIFVAYAFIAWKRMILHEKTRISEIIWKGFEVTLGIAMLSHFFRLGLFDIYFNIPLAFFGVWILVLCLHMKWVPQLTFQQKLIGAVQLLVILVCLTYFLLSINAYFSKEVLQVDDLYRSVFSIVLIGFILSYSALSLLFLLFNLPTSMVIEKKFREISIFQQLSDSIVEGKSESDVYNALLESSISTANADAGWVYTDDKKIQLRKNIDEDKVRKVAFYLKRAGYDGRSAKRVNPSGLFKGNKDYEFNSFMAVPLGSSNQSTGNLVLVKRLSHAFDRTMESNVRTYVSQAAIAVQNFRLLRQAVESERLKNELDIANRVQKSLLPQANNQENNIAGIRVTAISEAATEVGGDYYDYHKINDQEFMAIVADVAGKGISAAFNMAQMKGIFQSLIHETLSPKAFMAKTNAALAGCLEKNVFITASIFRINTKDQLITFSRAGHCPSIFGTIKGQSVAYLESKGLGLGILRGNSFASFLEEQTIHYESGDFLVLYTDGLVEARNPETQEEFGYERLLALVKKQLNSADDVLQLADKILNEIMDFSGNRSINDDFTLLVISLD